MVAPSTANESTSINSTKIRESPRKWQWSSSRTSKALNSSMTSVETAATRSMSLQGLDDAITHIEGGLPGVLKVKTQVESLSRVGLLSDTSDENSIDVPEHDSASSSPTKKTATFSKVYFRDYPQILGDNPSTTSGPPLSIGWDFTDTCSLEIDSYEEARGPRREKEQLLVPRMLREDWLRDLGYSRGEMREAAELAQRTQKHRQHNAKQPTPVVKLEETSEAMQRKFKRWILRAPSNKELYQEWSQKSQAHSVVGRVA